jgi:hypothetical protein
MHVGSHHAAKRQLHQVPANQFRRRHSLPCAVSLDGGVEGQTGLQGSKSGLRAAFLKVGQRGVEYEQGGDDGSLVILVEDRLQQNGRFEQPWHRCPEFGECIAQWMSRRIRHCIGAVGLKPGMRVIA